ncbi:MAG: sugar ABC transporter substrate-binding protein [Aquabacterium sp.]|jgi:ribose transport system substrate-binding protein|uniref:sugar ABC transporter substrate-binding protein n=1 Tax=Aquabacterium sp. TaxID=1872578 RepID=UPI003BB045D8
MTRMIKPTLFATALLSAALAGPAFAQDAALKGKTVAFVPTSLGYDLTDGWNAMVGKQLQALGIKWVVRDPNWSTDAGAQAITALISEKPDVLLVQNPDIQSYARLLKRAEDAGIRVVQVNMRSAANTSAFVGADWVGIGETMAKAVVAKCGKGTGKSGKVSIVQGVLTAAASTFQMKGVENVLAKSPEIKVVSKQAADWDASKARAVTDTTLKQNPDLCGVIGFWDGQDTGAAAAIREAKRQGDVFLVTNGGAAMTGCNNVGNGNFSAYMTYNVKQQSDEIVAVVKDLLTKPKPAAMVNKVTPVTVIDKASLRPDSCWNLADVRK